MCLAGGGWSRAGLPEGFSRCSVCVIYPFWKIQTYKCACCKSKGRHGTQVPNKANCIPLTFPGGFLSFNLCRFQPKHIKGKCMHFCWGSVGVISLSFSLSLSLALSKLHKEPWESRTWAKTACSQPLGFQNLTSLSCSSGEQNHTILRPPTSREWDATLGRCKPQTLFI